MKRTLSTALIAGFVLAAAGTLSAGQMPPTPPGPQKLPPAPCQFTRRCGTPPVPCGSVPTRNGCHPRMPPIGR